MPKSVMEEIIKNSFEKDGDFLLNLTEDGYDWAAITDHTDGGNVPEYVAFIIENDIDISEREETFYGKFEDLDLAVAKLVEEIELYQVRKKVNKEDKPTWMMNNLVAVDKGALKMIENIMRRAGKVEAIDELLKTYTEIEDVLKWYRENKPSEYMSGVTTDMIRDYT